MKPSPKFNHRRKFEREQQPVATGPVEMTTGAVDDAFEDFGERQDYAVAPGVVVHHFVGPVIERVRPGLGAE